MNKSVKVQSQAEASDQMCCSCVAISVQQYNWCYSMTVVSLLQIIRYVSLMEAATWLLYQYSKMWLANVSVMQQYVCLRLKHLHLEQ